MMAKRWRCDILGAARPGGGTFWSANTRGIDNMKWKLVAAALLACTASLQAASLRAADAIETLRSVGPEAAGAAQARQARDVLVAGGSDNLVPVLEGFRGSTVLASNWLRSTFEAIADQQLKTGKGLPHAELLSFVRDTTQAPAARRLAYEWLRKELADLEEQLIPSMLLDPNPEFRRDAVSRLVDQAKAANGPKAIEMYQSALAGAVHEDQVKVIAEALRAAEVEVDIQKHFGFLPSWKVIGPFNNRDLVGFSIAYPPEKKIEIAAEYDGQLGQVSWQPINTEDDYGVVDIGKQIENYKGSLMYATTTFRSDQAQSVELRLGTPNAWKLWVNGELVFQREEYHRSTQMDQYKIPVNLLKGDNVLLLKVCQNEQEQSWAQDYKFQLRVCDATGSAVLPADMMNDLSQIKSGS